MLIGIPCGDEKVHEEHEFTITLDTPCSGPVECGKTENHEPHRIIRQMDAKCYGVVIFPEPMRFTL